MNRRKYFLVCGLILALLAVNAAALSAASQANPGAARGRMRLGRLWEARNFIGQMNLTDDQKAQIKTILQNSRTQILQATRDVVKGRLDLIKGLPGAAKELADAQLQVANLKTQILERIKPILTPDQLAKMQERLQLREQRLQKLLDRLNSKIGG